MNDWELAYQYQVSEMSRAESARLLGEVKVMMGAWPRWIDRATANEKYNCGLIHAESKIRSIPSYPNDEMYMKGWEDGLGNNELRKHSGEEQ